MEPLLVFKLNPPKFLTIKAIGQQLNNTNLQHRFFVVGGHHHQNSQFQLVNSICLRPLSSRSSLQSFWQPTCNNFCKISTAFHYPIPCVLISKHQNIIMSNQKRKISSDMDAFHNLFNRANKIVALTGAGISAESGIPTFRGEGGFWRKYKAEELATPQAFAKDPGLVWQFYEYRRQLVLNKEPNLAHKALTLLESKFMRDSPQRQVIVVTQNVDELHRRAGLKRVLELHGSLFKTRCTQCGVVKPNYNNPICPALAKIELDEPDRNIDPKDLPRCDKCSGLLRPHVVWFGEPLDPFVLKQAEGLMSVTDFLLVIGTSSVVYPAASLVPQAANRGVVVSEFNIEQTAASDYAKFFFKGPCAQTLPKALQVGDEAIISWGTQ